jgi:hypothetical protein
MKSPINEIKTVLPIKLIDASIDLSFMQHMTLVWPYPVVLDVAQCLSDSGCVILGSDVYKFEGNEIKTTIDSTYYEPSGTSEDLKLSHDSFMAYVKSYVARNGDNYLFSTVISRTTNDDSENECSSESFFSLEENQAIGDMSVALVLKEANLNTLHVLIMMSSSYLNLNFSCLTTGKLLYSVASVFAQYPRIYPKSTSVKLGKDFYDGTDIIFSLVPKDNYSGHLFIMLGDKSYTSFGFNDLRVNAMETELGLLETFGKRLGKLLDCDIGTKISLLGDIV